MRNRAKTVIRPHPQLQQLMRFSKDALGIHLENSGNFCLKGSLARDSDTDQLHRTSQSSGIWMTWKETMRSSKLLLYDHVPQSRAERKMALLGMPHMLPNLSVFRETERGLSACERLLLLQRARMWFPGLTSGGWQLSFTPTARDPLPSSGLHEHLHSCSHTHTQTLTNT